MSECRSCHAPVVFAPSEKSGKSMILDATPKKGVVLVDVDWTCAGPDPGYRFEPDLVGTPLVAKVVDVYTDHHATCPNAADWKGRTR